MSQDQIKQRVIALWSDALMLPPEVFDDNSRLGFCDWWDSLNHIYLLVVLSEEFGFEITPAIIENSTTLENVVQFISNSGLERSTS